MVHATDTPTVLLGLDGFVLLAATDHDHEVVLLVETIADRDWCRTCGTRAGSKGRARVTVRDVPVGDRPVMLVWKKRVWRCEQLECPAGSWRETSEQIRPRRVLTENARRWAVRRVGQQAVAVSQVADDLGVGWHTVNDAVLALGTQMIDGDDRLDCVRAVGVDEHNVLRGTFNSPTTWGTAFVDLDSGRLLDVVENRTAAAVTAWFAARGDDWCRGITQAALDPYEGYSPTKRDNRGLDPKAVPPEEIPNLKMVYDLSLVMSLLAWPRRPGRGGDRQPDAVGPEGRGLQPNARGDDRAA